MTKLTESIKVKKQEKSEWINHIQTFWWGQDKALAENLANNKIRSQVFVVNLVSLWTFSANEFKNSRRSTSEFGETGSEEAILIRFSEANKSWLWCSSNKRRMKDSLPSHHCHCVWSSSWFKHEAMRSMCCCVLLMVLLEGFCMLVVSPLTNSIKIFIDRMVTRLCKE